MLNTRRCNYQEKFDPVDQCHQNAIPPLCLLLFQSYRQMLHMFLSISTDISRVFSCYKTVLAAANISILIILEKKSVTVAYDIFTLMSMLTFSYYPKSSAIPAPFTVNMKMCYFYLLEWRPTLGLDSKVIPTQITGRECKGILSK